MRPVRTTRCRFEAEFAREDAARHRDGSDFEYEMARSELELANGGDNRRGA
jgi:hypothetical protein